MGKAYSLDLRERIVRHVANGQCARDAGRVFGVVASTAIRLAAAHRVGRDIGPLAQGHAPGTTGKLAQHTDFLIEIVQSDPDITLAELAGALEEATGVSVHLSSIHHALGRARYSYKKGLIAAERERKPVRDARRDWVRYRQPAMRAEPHRLVFIDETSVKTTLTRLRGRSPVGERLFGAAPFGRWSTQTFIAGLTNDEPIAPWVLDRPMNGAAFDVYIETQLAPLLSPGTGVVLDNPSTRKSPRAAAALKKRGCWFLFLPPYSPDFNPIEMAFSKLKAHLRRIGARTYDQLITALGDICDLFTPDQCAGFLMAAGYDPN